MLIVPTQKQLRVIDQATHRWNLLMGATRSGKTYATFFMLPLRIQAMPRRGGLRVLLAKTMGNVETNLLAPLREIYGPTYVSEVYRRSNTSWARLFGVEYLVAGADNTRSVSKLQGKSIAHLLGDEGPTWPAALLQMLKTRLDRRYSIADITGNPEGPRHHFKRDLIDRADELDVYHASFVLEDNDYLDPEVRARLRRELTGVWYLRLVLGLWAAAEGAIYDSWDEGKYVIDALPARPDGTPAIKRWFVGVDYGTGNPTVFLLIGEGSDDALYVAKEYYWDSKEQYRQKSDSQYVEDLIAFLGDVKPSAIYIDPSAASFKVACRQKKLPAVDADNAVVDGVRFVGNRLTTNRLFILRGCEHLLGELPGYVWDQKAALRGEDKPLKVDDHACDALRYGVFTPYAPPKRLSSTTALPVDLKGRFSGGRPYGR